LLGLKALYLFYFGLTIATLLKLASYDKQDLENPHGNINKEIIAKAEGLGLTLGKDFIAKWLKKADEVL